MNTESDVTPLFPVLQRLAMLQREAVDRLALQEACEAARALPAPEAALRVVARHLQVRPARWRTGPDAADLPALVVAPDGRWGILRGKNATGQWVCEWINEEAKRWDEAASDALTDHKIATLRLVRPYSTARSPVLKLVLDELFSHKGLLVESVVGSLLLAFLGILVSFYTMQVYDRVIPTGAMQTLLVLTFGILLTVLLEYIAKRARSRLYERLIDRVDQRLARTVYLRFLSVRLDQLPASVGSLASQLRGYESVRAFLVSMTGHLAVDAPFALLFVLIIGAIAGPLAYIPLAFLVVSLGLGLLQAGKVRELAKQGHAAANRKTGLLVESVEAAEIIKSGQGGWRMLGRWLSTTDEARDVDLQLRHLTEVSQYRTLAVQQASYVLLIATGAVMASQGELTMGALIACSILSGRVLNPITQIGMQVATWANVKASLQGLDAIWQLEDDHHGQEPVHLDSIQGGYRFDQVTMQLSGKPALRIPQLKINPGEKVGVIGPIGAGKTTLLRLLSGMYKPTEGRIWFDDVDLAHISKPLLADNIGYLPQDGRLLGGTLRDNLVLGLIDPGDEVILAAAKTTGLYESVVATHPDGLQQAIAEGGTGLSGGQRQLVHLTRVFLRKPRVWLLDEPTSSLDRNLETLLINRLKETFSEDDTLVLVTHKPELLQLVDRVVLISNQQVVIDGPRDAVLARLQGGAQGVQPAGRVAS